MKVDFKNQSVLFTFDQVMDSGLIFLFIALGGVLLSKIDMATVVLAQSTALVCVLFCSCFTTQYLLLKYKKQNIEYWMALFGFFYIITLVLIFFILQSPQIILLFTVGIVSEFLKRYCYYYELSLMSFLSSMTTVVLFCITMIFTYAGYAPLSSDFYIYYYAGAKLMPLIIVVIAITVKNRKCQLMAEKNNVFHAIKDSLKCGMVFAIITIIYWTTNQGFFILLQDKIVPGDLVEIRITQNVFGVVTMLITLYDSIFLKKNINNDKKIFNRVAYLKFAFVASVLIAVNYIFLYILSLTMYNGIDVLKYSIYLALAQWFFILSRMPILILKLRYNLNVVLLVYGFSLIVSGAYLYININSTTYFYIVEAIALANFLTFAFSSLIVVIKESDYGKVN
ncbi:hypothetical protein LVQ77_09480 [Buttiauxella sp. S04-F03]|uniref:hypothetical protein n=1 Tax=Buttiauxella sp. W03-F01 TaxID=2904524 RepID=UPI001E343AC9|nr:hypothetical protein [Buttiauxella sp. W03-F01]MCE0800531.1 hypothetical protein [Buttiauxella sp. W03-F01]